MKAILVNDDKSLSWSDVPNPVIKSEEVLVEIHAAALNRADLMQREGDYPPPPGCPEWMGLEIAGTIVKISDGAKEKSHWKVGDKVCALLGGGGHAAAAGCTISIPDYIAAIEKAYNAAKNGPEVAADATLKIGMYTEQSPVEATADKDGKNSADVYGFAAAVDANGKVIKGFSDCVQLEFTFDTAGKSKFDATKEIKSKFEKGSDYGMTAIGKQEWYIQAAAFDAQCEGKTGAEIAGLVNADGKGVESVQTAGCTITVSGLVKAASKI